MRVPFRQGIISAPQNFLSLAPSGVSIVLAGNEYVDVTVADGATNYTFSETRNTANAWSGPFTPGIDYWLYWDIDVRTGALSRGVTTVNPATGPTAPATPVNGTMWFDTTDAIMYEWQAVAQRWVRKIRVFAAHIVQGVNLVSMSIRSPDYTGTQAGIETNIAAGALVYDGSGNALKRGDGRFFTTEDVVSTGVGTSTRIKVEAVVLSAVAAEPIPAYSFVRFIDYGTIVPATNLLAAAGVYGMVERDVAPGEIVEVFREGILTNHLYDWAFDNTAINTPLFVDVDGQLTTTVQPHRPVGIVIDRNTVLIQSTIVDDIALIESAVTIQGPSTGVIVTGAQGIKSSAFTIGLANDLAAVEALGGVGVAHRDGADMWSVRPVEAGSEINGILAVEHGGTGADALTGYVKANGSGSPMTASVTVPGADIAGDIAGRAGGVSGVVEIEHGGTGAATRGEALDALLPPQTPAVMNHALVSDGTTASWVATTNGTVTSVDLAATTSGIAVSGGPVTASGTISVELTGNVLSLANVGSAGVITRSPTGEVRAHPIVSPTGTVAITNGDGANDTSITLGLPVIGAGGNIVDPVVDQYGRVVSGGTQLPWFKVSGTPTSLAGYGIADAYTKMEIDGRMVEWSLITNRPSSLIGYGITDAYTSSQVDSLTWNWSSITSTPSTLAGFGIVDGVVHGGGVASITLNTAINKPTAGTYGRIFINTTTNTIELDTGMTWQLLGNAGTVTSVGVASASPDIVVSSSPVTTAGTINLSLAGNLGGVASLATGGYAVRRGDGTWRSSALIGAAGEVSIIDGTGANNTIIGLADVGFAGTYYSVTVDGKGRVTGGDTSSAVEWSRVANTPTTLAGYGIGNAIASSEKGAANGVATLGGDGKIPVAQLPAIAISETSVVNSDAEMIALSAQVGDVAIRPDEGKTFILSAMPASVLSNWKEMIAAGAGGGAAGVTSVDASSTSSNLTITGGPIIDNGTLTFGLAGNLLAASQLATNGVIKRNGATWETGLINGATEITGVIPVANGGTGASSLSGYVKGNGGSGFTASATIPGSDIAGDIAGNAAGITGVLPITMGGTGAATVTEAREALLPPQTDPAFLATDGDGLVSWSRHVPGGWVDGPVPHAGHALVADTLTGGVAPGDLARADGTNASGTWTINTTGDAATVGGFAADAFAQADGTNATGTWAINTTGDAGSVGGVGEAQLARANGVNAIGTWPISVTGSAGSLSTVLPISQGGTGATDPVSALTALLPDMATQDGKVLMTTGVGAYWEAIEYAPAAGKAQQPVSANATNTIASTDAGETVIATGDVTVPAGEMAAGDVVWIYNDTADVITIIEDTGLTLRQVATVNTGNRTLDAYGVAKVWFRDANTAIVSGDGIN